MGSLSILGLLLCLSSDSWLGARSPGLTRLPGLPVLGDQNSAKADTAAVTIGKAPMDSMPTESATFGLVDGGRPISRRLVGAQVGQNRSDTAWTSHSIGLAFRLVHDNIGNGLDVTIIIYNKINRTFQSIIFGNGLGRWHLDGASLSNSPEGVTFDQWPPIDGAVIFGAPMGSHHALYICRSLNRAAIDAQDGH